MKWKLLISFFLICLIASQETDRDVPDTVFDHIFSKNITDHAQIDTLKKTTDITYFVYYYKKTSKNSRLISTILIQLSQKLQFISEFLLVNCESVLNSPKICQDEDPTKDTFPRMVVLSPPEFRINPYTKQLNTYSEYSWSSDKVSEQALFNFITKYVPSHARKLTGSTIDSFLNADKKANKIILFTKQPKTPLMFRGLSNIFFDRILMGEVIDTETEVVEKFKITKFPTLLAYVSSEDGLMLDSPRVDIYTGEINIKDTKAFIEKYAAEDKSYLNADQKKTTKSENLIKVFNKNDLLSYINKNNNKKLLIFLSVGSNIPKYLTDLAPSVYGFFLFGFFDCENEIAFCQSTFKVKRFPALLHFKEGNSFESRLSDSLTFPLNYKEIIYEIFSEYKTDMKEATINNINQIIFSSKNTKKTPMILLYDTDFVPPGFYLISTDKKYTKVIDFVVYSNPSKEAREQFNSKKLPQVSVVIHENDESDSPPRLAQMRLPPTYLNLKEFCDEFVKEADSHTPKVEDKPKINQELKLIHDNASFDEHCKSKNKPCVLAFLNGNFNNKKYFDESFTKVQKTLESVRAKSFVFGWINATCHTEILQKFNIQVESLPNLAIYFPKKEAFSNLIGLFDADSIGYFMELFALGKTPINSLKPNEVKLKDIKCEEIKEIVSATSDDDDEILKEILEEEKKKRADFEKERAKARNSKKKRRRRRRNTKKKSDL